MSGIVAADNCVKEFNTLKLQNGRSGPKRSYIIFRIKGEKIEMAAEGEEGKTWEEFTQALASDERDGAYGLYDYHGKSEDGRIVDKIVFVSWTPDNLPVKAKMLYGATCESFKSELGSGIAHHIQACGYDDVAEDKVKSVLLK